MICPHCRKNMRGPHGRITQEVKDRAKSLRLEGFTLTDINKLLFAEGVNVSLATLSRMFCQKKKDSVETVFPVGLK